MLIVAITFMYRNSKCIHSFQREAHSTGSLPGTDTPMSQRSLLASTRRTIVTPACFVATASLALRASATYDTEIGTADITPGAGRRAPRHCRVCAPNPGIRASRLRIGGSVIERKDPKATSSYKLELVLLYKMIRDDCWGDDALMMDTLAMGLLAKEDALS